MHVNHWYESGNARTFATLAAVGYTLFSFRNLFLAAKIVYDISKMTKNVVLIPAQFYPNREGEPIDHEEFSEGMDTEICCTKEEMAEIVQKNALRVNKLYRIIEIE